MCLCVIVIDITQPVHVVFQNISLSIAETMQIIFGFFVSFFMSLHCEDSHTTSIFIKSCSHYLWHIKSQNMHAESFISCWISFVFCEKTLSSNLVECFHIVNEIFQLFSHIATSSISVITRNGEFFAHKRRSSHKSDNVLVF